MSSPGRPERAAACAARGREANAGRASAAAALRARQERLLDDGLAQTFPASDPLAVMRLT